LKYYPTNVLDIKSIVWTGCCAYDAYRY